jgi:replicative DNA helicase
MNTNQYDEQLRTPGHNVDAERSCLGAIILDNSCIFEVQAILRVDSAFYFESHRVIFNAAKAMAQREEVIDVITLCDFLKARNQLDAAGGANYIARLSQDVPSSAHVDYYALIIRRWHEYRQIIDVARRAVDGAFKPHELEGIESPDELIARTIDQLMKIIDVGSKTALDGIELDRIWYDAWRSSMKGEQNDQCWSTGLPLYDSLLGGGIYKGRSYYVGGLTKMGKTTHIIDICRRLMRKHDFAIDYWSVEQQGIDIYEKFVSSAAGVDFEALNNQYKDQGLVPAVTDQIDRVEDAREWLATDRLRTFIRGMPDMREIAVATRARVARLGSEQPYLLVIDYLQNCHDGNGDSADVGTQKRVSNIANGITKDYGIPGFFLFQFNREAESAWQKYRQRPNFSQVKGTSQYGNDANYLYNVHRNWSDMPDHIENEQYTTLTLDLSRHGNRGKTIELRADMARNQFTFWQGGLPPAAKQWEAQNEKTRGTDRTDKAFPRSVNSWTGANLR